MTPLSVESCDPRARESEIRELFLRNGQPEFGAVFERAYRPRAEEGLRSWVGLDDGRVVMHISVLPVSFRRGERTTTAGILGDLMVDEGHRDFWAPVQLLRTMLADVQRDGSIQFLLTSSVADAEPVFKAGGFKPLAPFRRYVLPLFGPTVFASRLLTGTRRADVSDYSLDDPEAAQATAALGAADMWRPEAGPGYYSSRIPRQSFIDGTWVRVENGHRRAGWALLSRNGILPEATLADAYWEEGGLPGLMAGAATWARRNGLPRLSVMALDCEPISRQLRKAGFIRRPPSGDMLCRRIGAEAPTADELFLTGFILNSW